MSKIRYNMERKRERESECVIFEKRIVLLFCHYYKGLLVSVYANCA